MRAPPTRRSRPPGRPRRMTQTAWQRLSADGNRSSGRDREYRRRLTDDEVRALGYVHRDSTSRWVHRSEVETSRRREVRNESVPRGTVLDAPLDDVGAALRDARDLEAAIAWQPPTRPRRLSQPER